MHFFLILFLIPSFFYSIEAGECQVHSQPDYLSLNPNKDDKSFERITVSNFADSVATILGLSSGQTEKQQQPLFYSSRPLEIPSSTWLFHIEGVDRLSDTGISLEDNGEFDIDSLRSKLSQIGNSADLNVESVIIASESDMNNLHQTLQSQISQMDKQASIKYIVIVCDDCQSDKSIEQLKSQLTKTITPIIQNDNQTLAMTIATKQSARVRRARQAEAVSANVTIAVMYSDEYPVMFNLFFWTSLVLVLIIISIVYVFLTLDPGADTIIYRMTAPRLKAD